MENKMLLEEDQISVITFQVGGEEFVIDLLNVKEIIQTGQIRRLPRSYDFIEGIYNYRGNIIHIINLKKKLNLGEMNLYNKSNQLDMTLEDDKKFIIIVNIKNMDIGFYVDKIVNISNILVDDIVGLSPVIQTNLSNIDYINGIVKFEDKPRIFIDLHRILSDAERVTIEKDQVTF